MSDRQEIEDLIFRYGYIIDEKQWDRLDELFTETGSFEIKDSEVQMNGFADLDAQMRSIRHPLVHYSTNVLIDVVEGADTATAQVKVIAPRADGTISMGKYNDDLVRTERGWRFERRFVVNAERFWYAAPRTEQ